MVLHVSFEVPNGGRKQEAYWGGCRDAAVAQRNL